MPLSVLHPPRQRGARVRQVDAPPAGANRLLEVGAERTVDDVEALRNQAGGFDIEASIIHSDGVSELYVGEVKGPRIDLGTDAVLRSASTKPYAAATRMYGLVDGHLLWAWDIAALGQELKTHASGRLRRVD